MNHSIAAGSLKPIRFSAPLCDFTHRADGTTLVTPKRALGPYHARVSDPFVHWALEAPDRVLFAERDAAGDWRKVTWGEALGIVRRLGAALIARKLSAERPLAVLSGNSLDHGLLTLAAHYVGVPIVPVSAAYSLVSRDFGKLRHSLALITPGLVFVEDGEAYGRAVAAAVPPDTEVVVSRRPLPDRAATSFAELASTPESGAVEDARRAVTPETILKFLLTSGSTGLPKAVIVTHRMLCANQAMIRQTIRCIEEEPPVLVDWLPWNHTFGGNHNFGIFLFNGGSMYIDEGRPMPGAIDATARNLEDIAPTIYYNVPKGFEALLPHLRNNAALRKNFFSRLQASFFAGAGLSAHVWRALDEIAIAETGYRMPMLTGLGATETAPFSMSVTPETSRSGHVGLPVPGNHIKLVPNSGKLEVRVKGDNVTPGYWREPELTKAAFDEEGYYKFGDALKPVDPADLSKGYDFDGRIAEDFKLASATWVSVGPLRVALIGALAPFARDVVIAAPDRDYLTAIVIPDLDAIHEAFAETRSMTYAAKVAHEPLRARLAQGLAAYAVHAKSNSTRIERIVVLDEPPSIDVGEITDKGSINQRAVLAHRAKLVEALFSSEPPAAAIAAPQKT